MYSFDRIKEELTITNILRRVSELTLWRHYLGCDFKIGKLFTAPYRIDRTPSFSVFYSFKLGKYLAKDLGRGRFWDVFDYIQMIYCVDLYTALVTVNLDFDLGLDYNPRKIIGNREPVRVTGEKRNELRVFEKKIIDEIEIQVSDRGYNNNDAAYWKQYGLSSTILRQYNVIPVQNLYIDKILRYTYNPNNPCYAYYFPANSYRSRPHFKCYWPLASGRNKWKGNISNDADIQGYDQCDIKGSTQELVLTKSLKDVMVLRLFGIDAMAIHGETQRFNPDFMRHIKKYYRHIISLYDRDASGISGARYLWKEYKIVPVFVSKFLNQKDISDVYKYCGRGTAEQVVDVLLQEFRRLSLPAHV